jgi:hypothetical protein
MKRNLLLAIQVLLFSNCKERISSSEMGSIPEVEIVNSTRLTVSDSIGVSSDLLFIDDLLFISDFQGSKFFKVIDVKSDRVINSFGAIGDGPCEIKRYSNIQIVNDSTIGVFVRPDFRYVEFNFENIDSIFCINETSNFDFGLQKLVKVGKNKFLGAGLYEGRFILTNNLNYGIDSVFMDYPFHNDLPITYEEKAMLFQGNFTYNPSKGFIAFATRSTKSLDILSINKNEIKSIARISGDELPIFSSENSGNSVGASLSKDNIWGYLSITSSNSHIYVLYSGRKTFQDYNKSNIVLVIDWNGNLIRKISLDREVSEIAVNQNESILVGYVDDGNSNLILFNLPDNL